MNKQRFKQIVKNYTDLSVSDRIELHELAKEYPYSQIIHALVAKANSDANTDIAQQTLNYAAMYVSDRAILKGIIEAQPQEEQVPEVKRQMTETEAASTPSDATEKEDDETPHVSKGTKVTLDTPDLQTSSSDIANELWNDLEKLKESKARYLESTYAEDETTLDKPTAKKTTSRTKATTTKSVSGTKKTRTAGKTVKSTAKTSTSGGSKTAVKKEPSKTSTTTKSKSTGGATSIKRTGASGKKTTATKKSTQNKSGSKTTGVSKEKDTKSPAESKSTSKVDSKKKVKSKLVKSPVDEQRQIIENFIDKEPRISAKTPKAIDSDQKDLSEKSTAFTEDLISENLARILIAQGKKEKAIEIYKKLIWKFPQKKSYFATQIEDLQK